MLPITELEIVARLVIAMVLGGIIGWEREMHEHPAGFRTHMLVCMGSALFTVTSFMFPGVQDPSRIAAGIVTGIGFLGAGAIFHESDRVVGLTTAADLWAIASIGLAIGAGYYLIGIAGAILVFLVLYFGKKVKRKLGPNPGWG